MKNYSKNELRIKDEKELFSLEEESREKVLKRAAFITKENENVNINHCNYKQNAILSLRNYFGRKKNFNIEKHETILTKYIMKGSDHIDVKEGFEKFKKTDIIKIKGQFRKQVNSKKIQSLTEFPFGIRIYLCKNLKNNYAKGTETKVICHYQKTVKNICPKCNGTGKIDISIGPKRLVECKKCRGTGRAD